MTNNKQQTAVDWLYNKMFENKGTITKEEYEQAKEMNKEQSQAYAAFCVGCDRKELPLLEFDGWVKLEGNNKL